MLVLRLTPLVISSLLLSPLALAAGANDSPSDTMLVNASKQSPDSASAKNVSSVKVSAEELAQANVTRTDELPKVLPGLTMGNSGSLIFQSVSLRGISSAQDFYNPAVSIYVDGVPQLSTYAMQALGDVESVEMLRGPQGTLYGKSAQGGIINIVTRKPDDTPRGYVEGGIASRDGYHTKVNLSGPLATGLLYGSATLLRQVDNGSMTNPATGSDNLGGSRTNLGDFRLRLAPEDQPWEASVAVSEECTHATQDTYLPYDNEKSRTLEISDGSGDPHLRRCTHSQSLSTQYRTDGWLFSLIGAWQQQNYQREFPYSAYNASLPERWNQDTQELRAATFGGNTPVDMVFGLYRQNSRETVDSAYTYSGVPISSTRGWTANETLAAYSDLTWHLTDRFDLGGGLRYSHDKSKTDYNGSSMGYGWGDKGKTRDDNLLGQVSAGWQFTPELRGYVRVAQGYKPAGFSIQPTPLVSATPYDAEKSINYEIGSRYEGDALRVQGALFYTHTKNLQLYSGPVGYQSLSNAGAADATGAELSASWTFTPGWSWDVNGNWVRSEFTGDSELYADNRVPFVPRFSAGTSLNGIVDTPWGALTPRLALNLVGEHYFDGDNTLRQGSYATTDIRLGWQATERVNITAYIDNLMDRRYRTYGIVQNGAAYAQVNNGRTAGLDVRVDLF
ncbi:TonB-dependent siderophore receptor [Erwinia sp. INIA-01]|uniref:TonB-dependent siderophore receptor n=1 Tax=Erwinia sp. INIA01 TaxID=2991500 RepID=UPI002225B18C|nr:TonB-dependent siderophore receptor [Erwinia sp. INIA01]MCW1876823.1 TonB-dependent siderophore receptor [Erwinia sp. INIA01]